MDQFSQSDRRRNMLNKLTDKELGWRDNFFYPVSFFLYRFGIKANHITWFGIFLITAGAFLIYAKFTMSGVIFALAGVLTDAVDGPRARFIDPLTGKNNISALGTILDHTRDFYFTIVIGFFVFLRFGKTDVFEIFLGIMVFLSYFLIFIAIMLNYKKSIQKSYNRGANQDNKLEKNAFDRFSEFCKSKINTTFYGRFQITFLIAGIILLFMGKYYENEFLIKFSYAIFGGEIAFGIKNLIDDYIMRDEG